MDYSTYCPEDNKLRLYVGRVPRDQYEALRKEGWTSTPKQDCDFVAHWTPERAETARNYSELGEIEDEDQGPEDRAADRAERFSGYLEKRLDESTGHADRYDGQPQAHGYQNHGRAVRAADRHDRIATRAVSAWDKAEYWQHRTAGVISHALHVSTPAVRMGRIKELESAIRKSEKSRKEYEDCRALWLETAGMEDGEKKTTRAKLLAYVEHGHDYTHPRTGKKTYLYDLADATELNPDPLSGAETCALWLAKHGELAPEGPWLTHYRNRLAYENQMLEAQGGRAAFVEMIPGGWLGSYQIRKVNKSNATGRVVSVLVRDKEKSAVNHWGNPYPEGVTKYLFHTINIERLGQDVYTPPTDEDKAKLAAIIAEEKAGAPKVEPCPLINPTEEEARKLQDLWNEKAYDRAPSYGKDEARSKILKMTQAQYSTADFATEIICETGHPHRSRYGKNITRHDVFKIRRAYGSNYGAYRVIVITDKPQKAIPWEKIEQARAKVPTVDSMRPRLGEIQETLLNREMYNHNPQLIKDAEYVGWVDATTCFPSWTEKGSKAHQEFRAAPATLQPELI